MDGKDTTGTQCLLGAVGSSQTCLGGWDSHAFCTTEWPSLLVPSCCFLELTQSRAKMALWPGPFWLPQEISLLSMARAGGGVTLSASAEGLVGNLAVLPPGGAKSSLSLGDH